MDTVCTRLTWERRSLQFTLFDHLEHNLGAYDAYGMHRMSSLVEPPWFRGPNERWMLSSPFAKPMEPW